MLPILPTYLRGASKHTHRILAEEEAIQNADTSHLDNKRVEIYISHIKRETEKALLCRIGHWHGNSQCEAWVPKSRIEFTHADRKQTLIPVWLAKRIGIPVTIRTPVVD